MCFVLFLVLVFKIVDGSLIIINFLSNYTSSKKIKAILEVVMVKSNKFCLFKIKALSTKINQNKTPTAINLFICC
jgi:hypothetical protein